MLSLRWQVWKQERATWEEVEGDMAFAVFCLTIDNPRPLATVPGLLKRVCLVMIAMKFNLYVLVEGVSERLCLKKKKNLIFILH